MKHAVATLEGALLDAAVAKAEGHAEIELAEIARKKVCQVVLPGEDGEHYWTDYYPSTEWDVGGPIIERERIELLQMGPSESEPVWAAGLCYSQDNGWFEKAGQYGPTPLIAAMRAYVASRFGEEVELP